jgi:hypothetical protein
MRQFMLYWLYSHSHFGKLLSSKQIAVQNLEGQNKRNGLFAGYKRRPTVLQEIMTFLFTYLWHTIPANWSSNEWIVRFIK